MLYLSSSIPRPSASWPRSRSRWLVLFALCLALAISLAAGCERNQIEVTPASANEGREALIEAVTAFSSGDRSPSAYREMALTIERLLPTLNAQVEAEAERHLVFLALDPLSNHSDKSYQEQLEALALTVWPTALEASPTPEEDAWEYTQRLCAKHLAPDCKQIVPEYRAQVLSQVVWSRLKERARDALMSCDACEDDPQFANLVDRYEERERALFAEAGEATHRAHPKHWPIAGDHANPWQEAPLVTMNGDGVASLAGEKLAAGTWSTAFAEGRGDADTLGVWMPPSSTVGRLRLLAGDARKAGYAKLRLQVRAPEYPYELMAYDLELKPRQRVAGSLRDQDSIQLFVSDLDAKRAKAGPAESR